MCVGVCVCVSWLSFGSGGMVMLVCGEGVGVCGWVGVYVYVSRSSTRAM